MNVHMIVFIIAFLLSSTLITYLGFRYYKFNQMIQQTTGENVKNIIHYYRYQRPLDIREIKKTPELFHPFFKSLFLLKYLMLHAPQNLNDIRYLFSQASGNYNYFKDKEKQKLLLSLIEENEFEQLPKEEILHYQKPIKSFYSFSYFAFFLLIVSLVFFSILSFGFSTFLYLGIWVCMIVPFLFYWGFQSKIDHLLTCIKISEFPMESCRNEVVELLNLFIKEEHYPTKTLSNLYIEFKKYILKSNKYPKEIAEQIDNLLYQVVDFIYYYTLAEKNSEREITEFLKETNYQIKQILNHHLTYSTIDVLKEKVKLREQDYIQKYEESKMYVDL